MPGSKEFYSGLSLLSLEYDANKNPGIFDTLVQLDPEELISKVRKGEGHGFAENGFAEKRGG